jgi:hypothetical protein
MMAMTTSNSTSVNPTRGGVDRIVAERLSDIIARLTLKVAETRN